MGGRNERAARAAGRSACADHVLAASKLHADDTPVPVLAPGNGKTKTGRLWTYVRDDRPAGDEPPAVWFAYSPDRKGEHPKRHLQALRARCRPMPTPASISSTKRTHPRSRLLGACAAQVPRICMWRTLRRSTPEAIERIAALYAIEKEIRGSTPEDSDDESAGQRSPLLDR